MAEYISNEWKFKNLLPLKVFLMTLVIHTVSRRDSVIILAMKIRATASDYYMKTLRVNFEMSV